MKISKLVSKLVGLRVLDAVDFGECHIPLYGNLASCATLSFRLDGVAYTAVEDPGDGYRSCMTELRIERRRKMTNTFPPAQVLARQGSQDGYATLELIDVVTGKLVLEVGTKYTGTYYPCYVARFAPESMAINCKRKKLSRQSTT